MSQENFKVSGKELMDKIKNLLKEGNIRKIVIKNSKGKTYIEIPVNIGIIGALIAPAFIAIGAIAALATSFTIEVTRKDNSK